MFQTILNALTPVGFQNQDSSSFTNLLERTWANRWTTRPPGLPALTDDQLGSPDNRSPLRGQVLLTASGVSLLPASPRFRWPHMIYGYLIESSRIVEVFRSVLQRTIAGENLGAPTPAAAWWLRTTEELFFRYPSDFGISSLRSDLRPQDSAIRRNAYHRLLGMTLAHEAGDGAKDFDRGTNPNTGFLALFEEFLREVWVAIENQGNIAGVNPTDPGKIEDLARQLYEMLRSRRQGGNLAREEFNAVVTASWFHLSVREGIVWPTTPVSPNSPVVDFLRGEAASPHDRLGKIAERVQEPIHAQTRSLFAVAESVSDLLIEIERGEYLPAVGRVQSLYNPAATPNREARSRHIIRHWALITGRDPKAKPTRTGASGVSAPPVQTTPNRVSQPALYVNGSLSG